jgi:hypothetical protein
MMRPVVDGDGERVRVAVQGAVVVLTPTGCLDADAGTALLGAAEAAIASGAGRLDVDLRSIDSSTAEGAASLVACRALAVGLAEGLHYRTGRGPGRQALLAAYTEDGAPSP